MNENKFNGVKMDDQVEKPKITPKIKLRLVRSVFKPEGIFGELQTEEGKLICHTLVTCINNG